MGSTRIIKAGTRSTLLLWAGLAGVLWGCSSGGGGGKEAEAPPRVYATRTPMNVLASEIFRDLMTDLEPAFEREHPEFDLIVSHGQARAPLDADQDLQRLISDGAQADVFLAGDLAQVEGISREPLAVVTWAGNRLVLIRRARSRLRLIDLSRGTCEVGVALERTPLGRASRVMLESRGLVTDLSSRVGLFNDAQAIVVRAGSAALEEMLGIVWATSLGAGDGPIEVVAVLAGDDGEIEHVAAVWTEQGSRFADWLLSPTAQEIARRKRFLVVQTIAPEGDQGPAPDGPSP